MMGLDPGGSGGAPDIYELFCHYNALYFRGALSACAVSWAEDPLPDRDVSMCEYYPGGGGCMILLSKSLGESYGASDLKNALLHEMIHAYICIKDNNCNHSEHGAKFQKAMKGINSSSVADPHRPVDGYGITLLHEIRKKCYHYKCESCGDLVKSIKMSGPSRDDCIEAKVVDDLCQNSKCHWHRHRQQCSGSYCRVQESSHGSLKRSKETLNDAKAEEPVCKSSLPTHTSNKSRRSNKNEQEDARVGFLNHTDSAVGCSGLDSTSSHRCNKKIKLSKDANFDLQMTETVQEAPKRPRTAILQNQECSRRKKRKQSKSEVSYSVIIEWLNYYCVSESDEEDVPLINKRTERRKRQKVHEMSIARELSNGVGCASPAEHTVEPAKHTIDGTKDSCIGSCSLEPGVIVPASRPEERSLPNDVVLSHGVAGNQAQDGHESMPSALDSPVRGEIVDISDS